MVFSLFTLAIFFFCFNADLGLAGDIKLVHTDVEVSVGEDYGEGEIMLVPVNLTHTDIRGHLTFNVPLSETWASAHCYEKKGNTYHTSPSMIINMTFCDWLQEKYYVAHFLEENKLPKSCSEYVANKKIEIVSFFPDTTPYAHMLHGNAWRVCIHIQRGSDVLLTGAANFYIDRTEVYRKRQGRQRKPIEAFKS